MFFTNFKGIVETIKGQNKLFTDHIICILIFAVIYYFAAKKFGSKDEKEEFKGVNDCLYFSCITHFTVGFGDITPRTNIMRFLTILQVLVAFALMNK